MINSRGKTKSGCAVAAKDGKPFAATARKKTTHKVCVLTLFL